MKKKKVLIYGAIKFPYGDAGSNRILNIGKMFTRLNYQVYIIGINPEISPNKLYKLSENSDIYYATVVSSNTRIARNSRFFLGGREYVKLVKNLGIESPDVTISYGGYFLSNYRAATYFSKRSNFILDIVEWYSKSQIKSLGVIKYLNNNYSVNRWFKKFPNKVVITNFLNEQYKEDNCLILPPIVDEKNKIEVEVKHHNKKTKIIYAGKNVGKDSLVSFIEAFKYLSFEEQETFDIQFYGVDKEELFNNISVDCNKKINFSIFTFNNRVPYSEILQVISSANFVILFRPFEKYSQAGFPSKVPEALNCGTPILCNLTSDLDQYLVDEYNSIICKNNTPKMISLRLKDIIDMSPENLLELKINSLNSAVNNLSINAWETKFNNFIETILSKE